MRRIAAMVLCTWAIAGVAAAALAPENLDLLSARSGGDATTDVQSRSAFTQHVEALDAEELRAFALGNRIFSTPWVEAPASVQQFDGLGPFFSSRSCSGCHVHDGRGRPPAGPGDSAVSVVVKLGIAVASGGRQPDLRYGGILSARAVQGLSPEGRLVVDWEDVRLDYFNSVDDSVMTIRRPRLGVTALGYGPLSGQTRLSLRVAPAVIGAGLLESVPDSVLARLADPDDADRDGVSGRVHWLPGEASGTRRAGRFGWKAAQGSVAAQVTTALAEDMGITTPARPRVELGAGQSAARKRHTGGEPELKGAALDALVDYCRLLAVPARRALDNPAVRRGAERFREIGCVSCHVPSLQTGRATHASLDRQVIHPLSDLLLHDMGPELTDGMPEGAAEAMEWRTAPLWGLGLAATVNGHRFLLHDGRARTPEEAILWHGGEGARSRDRFRELRAPDRTDLLRFLESL